MTSTKSSVKHASKYDLKRCFRENALIPLAAMLITSYFLWNFVMILVNNNYYEEYKWAIFTDYSGFNAEMFNMLYMMCSGNGRKNYGVSDVIAETLLDDAKILLMLQRMEEK